MNSIVSSSVSDDGYVPAEDRRSDVCPNCSKKLAKVPGSKTKCPHCARYIYVRTDPRFNARVCVGENDLEDVDDAIAKANGTWDERVREKELRARTEGALTEKFGGVPDASDVAWSMLNENFMTAAVKGDGNGMHLNAGRMADQLIKEKRYRDAVSMVARLLVIDWVDWHEVLPAWSSIVKKAIDNGVPPDEAKELFLEGCVAARAVRKCAINGEVVWSAVAEALHIA